MLIISLFLKDSLPVVAALGYMMGYTGYDDAGLSWHAKKNSKKVLRRQLKRALSPFILGKYLARYLESAINSPRMIPFIFCPH